MNREYLAGWAAGVQAVENAAQYDGRLRRVYLGAYTRSILNYPMESMADYDEGRLAAIRESGWWWGTAE